MPNDNDSHKVSQSSTSQDDEKAVPKLLKDSVFFSQGKIYDLIFWIVLIGALVPFAAQFLLPFLVPDVDVKGAEIWNQFVGIVLGVVATILSILSLRMCFDSLYQSRDTENRLTALIKNVSDLLHEVSQKQEDMNRYFINSSTSTATNVKQSGGWNTPPSNSNMDGEERDKGKTRNGPANDENPDI